MLPVWAEHLREGLPAAIYALLQSSSHKLSALVTDCIHMNIYLKNSFAYVGIDSKSEVRYSTYVKSARFRSQRFTSLHWRVVIQRNSQSVDDYIYIYIEREREDLCLNVLDNWLLKMSEKFESLMLLLSRVNLPFNNRLYWIIPPKVLKVVLKQKKRKKDWTGVWLDKDREYLAKTWAVIDFLSII